MLKLLGSVLLIFFLSNGCIVKKPSEPTEAEKEVIHMRSIERDLNYAVEKINLLAVVKNIPRDSVFAVLKDYYYSAKYKYDHGEPNYDNALLYATRKHNFPKRKVALIIFSFKCEMLSQEDVLGADAESPDIPGGYDY